MTARDIVFGRQGGRVEKWKTPAHGECRPAVTVSCACGRWTVSARDVGRSCWTCGEAFVLVVQEVVDEPLAVADVAAQEAGLARARRALGAA